MVHVQFNQQWIRISSLLSGLVLLGLLMSLVHPVKAQSTQPPEICTMPFQSVALPLTELGGNEYIRMDGKSTGFSGGLYPDGSNNRPVQHEAAGLELSHQIQPLTKEGLRDDINGRILLISIGMSNTATEFGAFMRLAQQKAELNPQLVLLNGALPNQIAERWANPDGIAWQELDRRITGYGFTAQQVQVVWIKLTNTGGGDFPQKAEALQADLQAVVLHLKEKFPNLKLVFLSSRTRSYTYWRGLSPEPLAYETGFAVKWLIEKQIAGDPALNFDPEKGEIKAPFLSWGPYLWADGENPRKDGFFWLGSDLTRDCTHPSPAGAEKVAQQLWEFFSSDSLSRGWFLSKARIAVPTISREIGKSPTASLPPKETPNPSGEITPFPLNSTSLFPTDEYLPVKRNESIQSSVTTSNLIKGGIFLLGGGLVVSVLISRRRRKKPVE